jgi:hypothetical protein
MKRRNFLKQTAGAVGIAGMLTIASQAAAPTKIRRSVGRLEPALLALWPVS